MKQLTAAFVRTVTLPGKYGDQHGLIRRVSTSGSKQWIWRGTMRPKRRDLGLGGYPYRSLAEARQMAFEYRKLARSGGDPATLRRNTAAPSFAEACEQAIEMRAPSWKDGGKSANNWRSTLGRFASPRLADMLVSEITSEDVLAVLLPVWTTRRATPIPPPAASPQGSSSKPSPCSSPCVRLKPPTEQETMTRNTHIESHWVCGGSGVPGCPKTPD